MNRTKRSSLRALLRRSTARAWVASALPPLLLFACALSVGAAAYASEGEAESTGVESVGEVAPESVSAGEKLFYTCAGCHTLNESDGNGVGPHLGNVLGRPFAGVEDFNYSEAMQSRGRDGLVWDTETLDQYLRNPQAFVTGTTMGFPGLPDRNDRATLIAWLAEFSGTETFTYREDIAVFDNQRIIGILNIEADPDYGEYLGGECVACHQRSQQSGGVPRIHGLTAAYFVDAMLQYQERSRENPVMQTIADSLGDAELASLARYFEQQ